MDNSVLWKYVILILILGQSIGVSGQNKASIKDKGLKNNFHQKIKSHTRKALDFGLEKKFDSAAYYSQKAIDLSKKSKNIELISYANMNRAKLLYWQNKTSEAKSLLDESLNQEIKDSTKLLIHYLYGEIEGYKKEYVQSLEHYISIEKIIDKKSNVTKRDSNRVSSSSYRIGRIQLELKNVDKAKVYFEKSLKYANSENLRSNILYHISTLYEKKQNLPTAIKYAIRATDIASKNKWQLMLPTYYAGLSEYYLQYKKPDSAIYYAKIGLKDNIDCRLDWLNTHIGNGYVLKKDFPNAIVYFNTALRYTPPSETLEVYKTLREVYTQTGQYKLALDQNELYLTLKDSLDNLKVKQEIIAITEKYESDKKQSKIKFLNEKNELNTIVIKKQKEQIITYIFSLFLLLTILGLIIFLYVKKQRQKHLLYLKNRQLLQKLKVREKNKQDNMLSTSVLLKKEEICTYITNLIDENFYLNKDITLLKMAKMANTNSSYLSKIINEDYDKSFTNFINDLRISYTLKKLESSSEYRKLTIEHIGENAGFSSSNAFYRAFKKHTGLTPSYYIKKRLQDGD